MINEQISILNEFKKKQREIIETIKSMDSDELKDYQKKVDQNFYNELKKLEHDFDISNNLMRELIIFSKNRNWYENLLLQVIFALKK